MGAQNFVNRPNECLNQVVKTALIGAVLMTVICHDTCMATPDIKKTQEQRRDKRNVTPQDIPRSAQLAAILAQVNRGQDIQGNTDLLQYTPTTPSPENVNCYVDIPVTRRYGGRCVPLGSEMGCQAGIYLAISHDCLTTSSATAQRGSTRSGPFLNRIRSGRGRPSPLRRRRQPRRSLPAQ